MHFKAPNFRHNAVHSARVGAAVFITGAFLLTSGIINKSYSQNTENKKGGDSVLLMQTDSTFKTMPQTAVKPDINKLYFPIHVDDSVFLKKEEFRFFFAEIWSKQEDSYKQPYGLSEQALSLCSPKERELIQKKWEDAKKSFVLAIYSKREGITPSNALTKIYDEKKEVDRNEIEDIMRHWEAIKSINNTEFLQVPRR